MSATKMALMTRLRAEGRWDEADRFREETRERSRADRLRRGEARQEALLLAAVSNPVLATAKPQLPDENGQRIEAVRDGIIIDHIEDERRQLMEVAARPEAWTVNLTVGESKQSIAWATGIEQAVCRHHQFPNDMKLLGRDGIRDFCPAPHPVAASPVCS